MPLTLEQAETLLKTVLDTLKSSDKDVDEAIQAIEDYALPALRVALKEEPVPTPSKAVRDYGVFAIRVSQ